VPVAGHEGQGLPEVAGLVVVHAPEGDAPPHDLADVEGEVGAGDDQAVRACEPRAFSSSSHEAGERGR
jgi:hypothetical protein